MVNLGGVSRVRMVKLRRVRRVRMVQLRRVRKVFFDHSWISSL